MLYSKKLILVTLFLIPTLVFSQKPSKYGKLTKKEKLIQQTELDPDASAIILSDHSEINFNGGDVEVIRHTRIKILNQRGMEEANVSLPYFAKNRSERIYRIKAHTLNVNENGKVEKIKIPKSEFYRVDLNENWKEIRFTFPSVKAGSIIEYEYRKSSENVVSLEEWTFQNKLPTLKSHLKVIIREGLDYKIVYNGRRLLQKYGNESMNEWILENIPPLKEEPLCPNPEDYVESVRFQLAGYKKYSSLPSGGTEYVDLMSSWEKLAEDMLQHKDYRSVLGQKRIANKLLPTIISEDDSDLEKVKKIYTYIQDNVDWNNKYRLFPNNKFGDILDAKMGNSADINLCLVRLLKSAGLNANPLIISTKRNGMVTKVYPLYSQFNHVLAVVELNGKDLLMDAVSKFRPYNLLSQNDLNGVGYLLSKKESRWVDIDLPAKTKSIIVSNLKFEEEQLKYNIQYSFFEHEAVHYRQGYHMEEGNEEFVTKYLLDNNEDEMTLDSFNVRYAFNLEKPLAVNCFFSKNMEEELEAEYIYIDPLVKKHYEKNPFIQPNRYLPVDFILPSTEKVIFNFTIPEGYELAEIPESKKFSTASQKSTYTYLFKNPSAKLVQLSSEFVIKDPLIMPIEYGDLREMFNRMMGLQSTQLVLKRKD